MEIFPSGFSSYSALVIAKLWNVLNDPIIEPPIHAEYFLKESALYSISAVRNSGETILSISLRNL